MMKNKKIQFKKHIAIQAESKKGWRDKLPKNWETTILPADREYPTNSKYMRQSQLVQFFLLFHSQVGPKLRAFLAPSADDSVNWFDVAVGAFTQTPVAKCVASMQRCYDWNRDIEAKKYDELSAAFQSLQQINQLKAKRDRNTESVMRVVSKCVAAPFQLIGGVSGAAVAAPIGVIFGAGLSLYTLRPLNYFGAAREAYTLVNAMHHGRFLEYVKRAFDDGTNIGKCGCEDYYGIKYQSERAQLFAKRVDEFLNVKEDLAVMAGSFVMLPVRTVAKPIACGIGSGMSLGKGGANLLGKPAEKLGRRIGFGLNRALTLPKYLRNKRNLQRVFNQNMEALLKGMDPQPAELLTSALTERESTAFFTMPAA